MDSIDGMDNYAEINPDDLEKELALSNHPEGGNHNDNINDDNKDKGRDLGKCSGSKHARLKHTNRNVRKLALGQSVSLPVDDVNAPQRQIQLYYGYNSTHRPSHSNPVYGNKYNSKITNKNMVC